MTKRRTTLGTTIVWVATTAVLARANINLELRPATQNSTTGQVVQIGFYAVSDTASDQSIGFVDAVLSWDPARLKLIGKTDNGPYVWLTSAFPNDANLDGLNEPYSGPSPFVPANDGDAFYQATRQFPPMPPALAPPAGLLITTFRFQVLAGCGPSQLTLATTGGPSTHTRVLNGSIPGLDVTGTIGSPAVAVVPCGNGLFCDGVEICAADACVPVAPPCGGSTPYCIESTDQCVQCLGNAQCDDGLFCNGPEQCTANLCEPGTDPCVGKYCNETSNVCFECLSAAECDDGIDCTADTCNLGTCFNLPLGAICDDGEFCNGAEFCSPILGCVTPGNPCHDPLTCDEAFDVCGVCPPPNIQTLGARYFSVTPLAGVDPILLLASGEPSDPDVSCLFTYVQADGDLGGPALLLTPDEWGTVVVTGANVIPQTGYRVCAGCDGGGLSASALLTTWLYGDTDHSGSITLDDILCVIAWFSSSAPPGSPCTRLSTDFLGANCVPDGVITVDDVLAVLNAFQGNLNLPGYCLPICLAGP